VCDASGADVHLIRVPIANETTGTGEYAICEPCMQTIESDRQAGSVDQPG
jgi:hypothetical protein